MNHRRKSIRIKKYDYSQTGMYFVTICAQDHKHLFGKIVNGKIILNNIGDIAQKYWIQMPDHFQNVELDEFIIMPNHMHGIVVINNNKIYTRRGDPCGRPDNRAGTSPAPTLGRIIGAFKSLCAHECINNKLNVEKLWQRNYYEHVIRNDESLNKIREYVIYNPLRWDTDIENIEFTNKLSPSERAKQIRKHNDELYCGGDLSFGGIIISPDYS